MRSVYLTSPKAPLNPRIFKKRIRRADADIRPGEVVALRNSNKEFVARAFYNGKSVIAARVLDRDENGPPIDTQWFSERLRSALRLRREVLRLEAVTDAYRVVHAEGDGLGALMIDWYAGVAVIEVGSRGMFEHLDEIIDAVRAELGTNRIVVRAQKAAMDAEGFKVLDRRAADIEVEIREHDLRFLVHCSGGHKTGFFVDQREARRDVAWLAKGRKVLDLCCYTGGFALAAARGGAESVVGVDLDEEAVARAKDNAALNKLDVSFEHADTFDFLRTNPDADLIVLDPPKLVMTPRALPIAHKKSVDFNRLALSALKPGGLLFTFCCSGLIRPEEFASQIREASLRAERPVRILRMTGQPPDHPVHVHCPEGRYLTGFLVQVV
ncbi:MAG: class I SAM-dependent rRNA methyltransferase [Planctomycetota bacterium]